MVTLFFSTAHAYVLEGAIHLPWTFIESNLQSRVPSSSSVQIQDFAFHAGEWTPRITRASLAWSWSDSNLKIQDTRLYWSSPWIRATIDLDRLVFDQYIVRDVNGSPVRIHIQASCGPIHLEQLRGQASLTGHLERTGTWFEPRVDALNLDWAQAWSINDFTCEGPIGTANLVKQSFLDALRNPNDSENLLKEHLSNELQRYWISFSRDLQRNIQFAPGGREIQMTGLRSFGSTGLWLGLELRGPESPSSRFGFTEPQDTSILPANQPAMIWTDTGVQNAVEKSLASIPEQTLNLDNVEGWANFLQSRFLQFFVWPDLLNFSRSAHFEIAVTSSNGRVRTEGESWSVDLAHKGVVRGERDGRLQNYLRLDGWSWSNWILRGSKNVLSLRMTDSETGWDWVMDSKYRVRYTPNTYISQWAVNKAITEWKPAFEFKFEAPKLQISPTETWVPQSWKKTSTGHWVINWGVEKP